MLGEKLKTSVNSKLVDSVLCISTHIANVIGTRRIAVFNVRAITAIERRIKVNNGQRGKSDNERTCQAISLQGTMRTVGLFEKQLRTMDGPALARASRNVRVPELAARRSGSNEDLL